MTTSLPKARQDRPRSAHVLALKGGMWSDIWLYVKYQFITKGLLALIVLPTYNLINTTLIQFSGRTSISSGDFKQFFLSPYGLFMAMTTVALLTFLIVTDVAAVVIAEVARLRGRPVHSAVQLLADALRSIPRFIHPGTLVLVAYTGLIVPLVGLGPALRDLGWVKIPNFVTDVIHNNGLYFTLYALAITGLAILAIFLTATFQAMFIDQVNPWQAMGRSVQFVRQHWQPTAYVMGRGLVVLVVTTMTVIALIALLPQLASVVLPDDQTSQRYVLLVSTLIVAGGMSFLAFIVAPVQVRNYTRAYAVLTGAIPIDDRLGDQVFAEDRQAKYRLITIGIANILGTFGLAALGAAYFDELFVYDHDIAVIAHRGGGDLDAENSKEGVLAAADAGSTWTEIDIQRTKDGHYVINHDATFARVAGVAKPASAMTVAEVKDLSIQNLFTPDAPARSVPTIEELMDAAKGRIGIFIELKGETADRQMVDDMAALITARGNKDSMALLSLDYDLIDYAETTYPELTTGYLYYFAVGDMTKLNADYLIMEEGVASTDTVATLHDAGKKVVVWTVNTPESIDRFAGSEVDGIITDKPREVYAGILAKRERDDLDRVLDTLLGS